MNFLDRRSTPVEGGAREQHHHHAVEVTGSWAAADPGDPAAEGPRWSTAPGGELQPFSLHLVRDVVTPGRPAAVALLEEVGHGVRVWDDRVGLHVVPGLEDGPALCRPGVGQAEAVVVAAPVADDDEVDVEGARCVLLAGAAVRTEGVLDGVGRWRIRVAAGVVSSWTAALRNVFEPVGSSTGSVS